MRNSYLPLAGAIVLTLTACGGGGGGADAPVTAPATPPTTVSPPTTVTPPTAPPPPPPSTPAPLVLGATTPATGVSAGIDAVPTLNFDAAPDMASVTAASVSLHGPIGPVETRLAQRGNSITLTPVRPLTWGSTYEVRIADTVRSAAGGKLAAARFTFETRVPSWGTVSTIAGSGPDIADLKTGGAANGDTLAVWTDTRNGARQVVASRYTVAGQSWSVPAVLHDLQRSAETPDLGVNPAGNGAAVWNERQASGAYVIKAARFDTASGWSAPVTLSKAGAASTAGAAPRLAINASGNIIAAWKQPDGAGPATIDSAYYDAASAQWTSASASNASPSAANANAANANVSDVGQPVVAIGADGNGFALWDEKYASGDLRVGVASARYSVGARAWNNRLSLAASSDSAYLLTALTAAIDDSGNLFAVWGLMAASGSSVQAARSNAGSTQWDQKNFATPAAPPDAAQLRVDNVGNALLAYSHLNFNGEAILSHASYWRSDQSWNSRTSYQATALSRVALGMDPSGNAVVAYVFRSTHMAWQRWSPVRAYDPLADNEWLMGEDVVSNYQGIMLAPAISVDQSGQAMLVWPQDDGRNNGNRVLAFSRLTGR